MPTFLFFPGSEDQAWLFGQLAIPGYISEITRVYLLAGIYNRVSEQVPRTQQRSVGSSPGEGRARRGGMTGLPGSQAPLSWARPPRRPRLGGPRGLLKNKAGVLFLHQASLKGRQRLNQVTHTHTHTHTHTAQAEILQAQKDGRFLSGSRRPEPPGMLPGTDIDPPVWLWGEPSDPQGLGQIFLASEPVGWHSHSPAGSQNLRQGPFARVECPSPPPPVKLETPEDGAVGPASASPSG